MCDLDSRVNLWIGFIIAFTALTMWIISISGPGTHPVLLFGTIVVAGWMVAASCHLFAFVANSRPDPEDIDWVMAVDIDSQIDAALNEGCDHED